MPYVSEWFEYKCEQNHHNKFRIAYPTTGDGIFGYEPTQPKLPEVLPCSGCNYKLVRANLKSISKGDYSEVDFYKFQESTYAESSAYHEAGHVVVGAVEKIPLRKDGIRIDQKGAGYSHYKTLLLSGASNIGSDPRRESAIRSTQAGYFAQEQYYRRFFNHLPPSGSSEDEKYINGLLEEMYSDRDQFLDSKSRLAAETQHLVQRYWQAIEAVAQTLLKKEWRSQAPPSGERRWSAQLLQKKMDGYEIVVLLKQFDLRASVKLSGGLASLVSVCGFALGYLSAIPTGKEPSRYSP